MKWWRDILGTVTAGALTAVIVWVASNVVWAEDLRQIEHWILIDQRRDISRDLRSLEKDALTVSEAEWKAQLEDELTQVQEAIEALEDDD